ncbi:hypothetical protein PYI73_06655 [Staphylococcus epidermidis]|nr:hypothetical protein [Staphylococcus epidermidis]
MRSLNFLIGRRATVAQRNSDTYHISSEHSITSPVRIAHNYQISHSDIHLVLHREMNKRIVCAFDV